MTSHWKTRSFAYRLVSLWKTCSTCQLDSFLGMVQCAKISSFESERRLGVRISPCKADAWVNANLAKPEASSRQALGLRMTKRVLIIAVGWEWLFDVLTLR